MTWAKTNRLGLNAYGHYTRESADGDFQGYQFRKDEFAKKVSQPEDSSRRCFVLLSPTDFYALPFTVVRPHLTDDTPRPYWSIGVDGNALLIVDGASTGVNVSQYQGDETIPVG